MDILYFSPLHRLPNFLYLFLFDQWCLCEDPSVLLATLQKQWFKLIHIYFCPHTHDWLLYMSRILACMFVSLRIFRSSKVIWNHRPCITSAFRKCMARFIYTCNKNWSYRRINYFIIAKKYTLFVSGDCMRIQFINNSWLIPVDKLKPPIKNHRFL